MSRRGRAAVFFGLIGAVLGFGGGIFGVSSARAEGASEASLAKAEALFGEEIVIPLPEESGVSFMPENPNGTNTASTGTARGHLIRGEKVIFYRTETWGEVEADFSEFRRNTKETLEDARGWARMGLKFVETEANPDLLIVLSDAAHLDATGGCSGDLSCTTWNNEVIINDLRWREGTEASRGAGMGTRDYQHMVINHEVGHWLGHYEHEIKCESGGPAPIMLQQSTGLRGCDSFNAWPLEFELWTLR